VNLLTLEVHVVALLCIVHLAISAQIFAETHSELHSAIQTMFDVASFQQASISPNGRQVAWVETAAVSQRVAASSAIYVLELNAPDKSKRVTAGQTKTAVEEHDVAWSPDSKQIAFLSDAAGHGQLQLFVTDWNGDQIRQLTHLNGYLSSPAWSRDGQSLAFLFTENASRASGPLVAETADSGEIDESLHEQRLAIVDVATGRLRQVSPPDLYVYEFDWAPDSNHLVISAAHGNGDDNWYVAGLFSINAVSGAMATVLEKPGMQISTPRWSLDGKKVAFIGGLMSDEPIAAGDIYEVAAQGGNKVNLTPAMKMSASWLAWLPDSKGILFSAIADGRTALAKIDVSTRSISQLWAGDERVSDAPYNTNLSLAGDGRSTAVVRQSFDQPPEVWAGAVGEWKQVTHENTVLHPAWGKSVSLHWKTDIGTVQGWLTYPANFDSSQKYPLVVRVHGGPSWAVIPYWPTRWDFAMALPSQGYFVLQPNFRGSYGQGESFTGANVKDFGYGDLRDIMAGIDSAIQAAPIDSDRLGITGWSYGGYMSMWAVTQTMRFRASVAGAGVSNWLSYYGENKVDQWLIPFMGTSVYDNPELYARSSPISFIKNVKTPTLVVVGDSDGECPAPQSYEFWHALKTLGVPTKLVIYPKEGHHFADAAHSRDLIERSVAWFNQYLQPH
jgi:dipeptidyl aminopeptidase/acylaminoacyl peptidase